MRFFIVIAFIASTSAQICEPTLTTAGGNKAPESFCSGDLIFEDNFDTFDKTNWVHEVTLGGGGNWEFQWYVSDHINSYASDGKFHIKPTLTSEIFGEPFLTSGRVTIPADQCTHSDFDGCNRTGTPDSIINPIRSSIVTTLNSFHYKFGRLEIRAKMPRGDWLWPALWLMPKHNVYGDWPRSGEIDLVEQRSNKNLQDPSGVNVGVEQAGSTLHFGPQWDINGFDTAHYSINQSPGYDEDFHDYILIWTPDQMQFMIDNRLVGTVDAGEGFWKRGNFENSGMENPWVDASLMAPFDQEFFIIMNIAAGGTNGFISDDYTNLPFPKPWLNSSPRAAADFWEARTEWEPTWNRDTEDSHMQVDYVRVYAL